MILENQTLTGIQSELDHLDEVMESVGFVRSQWEYSRATYDCKFVDSANQAEYHLRVNARVIEGKMEKPHTVLRIEEMYIGKASFPHGMEYDNIPEPFVKAANEKLNELATRLG